MSTVCRLELAPADARALLARVEAERPVAAAALTPGERETLQGEVTNLRNRVVIDLPFFSRLTGIALDTRGQLARLVRQLRRSFPSATAWENGRQGAMIIDRPFTV